MLEDNFKVLNAEPPSENYRFTGSNAPGQLFLPKEPVTLNFDFPKDGDSATVKEFAIEIQEITTRNPDARTKEGFTDTSGNALLLALEGQPTRVGLTVKFTDKPRAEFEVKNFPLPERYGTYAMILLRGDKRQFLGTLARLPQPLSDGTVDNTPIFGEGTLVGKDGGRAEYYSRLGVRGWRSGGPWREKEDGSKDWEEFDRTFEAAKRAGCQIMITLAGGPEWSRPFHDPFVQPTAGVYRYLYGPLRSPSSLLWANGSQSPWQGEHGD